MVRLSAKVHGAPGTSLHPARIPVLVGVSQLRHNRERLPDLAREPADLITEAVRQAAVDAGQRAALLRRADGLSVVRVMSWAYEDLPGLIATAVGATPQHLQHSLVGGNRPAELLDQAAARISQGISTVEIVCGGESTASVAACRKVGIEPAWSREPGGPVRLGADQFASARMLRHRLTHPRQAYPLYENGLRAQLGQTFQQSQESSARMYSEFSRVAAGNEAAWDPIERTPEQIATVGARNRYICFPYPLLMNAQNGVNQAAALIVTSLELARELGVADDHLVYVWGGAGAADSTDIFERVSYNRAPAMESALTTTLDRAGVDAFDLDVVDLYSCFPVVPKLAALVLGSGKDAALTATGGLTSFGGPANNYSMHSIVAVARRIRAGDRLGLVYANGELLTKHHAVLLAARVHPQGYVGTVDVGTFDVTPPPLLDVHNGSGTVETFTVEFDREGAPARGWVIGRTAGGARFPAGVDDRLTLAALTAENREAVGLRGRVSIGDDGLNKFALVRDTTEAAGTGAK